jgi:voltage-gated potassium channel
MFFIRTVISFLKDEHYRDLLFTSMLILSLGTMVYHFLEGWSWIDSLYFSVVTLTTIGYGDFSPQTDIGKLFTIFYILVGLGMILSFINTVYEHYSKSKREK